MINEQKRTISSRVSLDEFAKALDGMIAHGVKKEKLTSNSAIMRTAILICCTLNADPKSPASQESLSTIKQLWKISK